MRLAMGIVLCGSVLALATGCGKSGGTTAPAAPSLNIEGNYLIVGMEMFGEKLPDELVVKGPEAERTIKISGDKMIAIKGGKEDPATYKLDASKTPATIDMVGTKGSGKEEKMFGIVKLEGDTLTLCLAESEKAEDRPKEFKTTKEAKSMIMTLKKQK